MKYFIFVTIFVMAAIGSFLGCRLLKAHKKISELKTDRSELIKERSAQSDQLRLKGIEIDELKKELDKYSNVEIKVALTDNEKQMILDALDSPQYKAKVENPKTNYFIREIYRNLKERVKESIKK